MPKKRFHHDEMPAEDVAKLTDLARLARGDILKMTAIAGSGHPGGSMSSLEMYLLVAHYAKVDPANPLWDERDRIVTSHGHTSPGAYAALGRLGFFDVEWAVSTFRAFGSPFEGHVDRAVPGVEWDSGNLGQGLSAACGMALSARLRGVDSHVFCLMGDGEQQKGQISEARRFALKHGLGNLTAFVDWNRLQLSGSLQEIMPQNIVEEWRASGWHVEIVNGHDLPALYAAVRRNLHDAERPTVVLAHTVMSKCVSFMENDFNYHGKSLTDPECAKALEELGLENDLERLKTMRAEAVAKARTCAIAPSPPALAVNTGKPRTCGPEGTHDGRGAWGKALAEIARANPELPIAVFDCDLVGSVRTGEFAKLRPHAFFQSGIQEHHTAACAGACSTTPVLTFWSDFAVFGVDEAYNQNRLTDINRGQLKIVCTHCGTDVGEDGKTHQCIDYVGTFANFFGYRVILPADANHMDRATRFVASSPGLFFLGTGRRKLPVILDESGAPFYGGDYEFAYGRMDLLRGGKGKPEAAVLAMGQVALDAVRARDILAKGGVECDVWAVSSPLEIDREALRRACATGAVVTAEDHNVRTGLAAQVARAMVEEGLTARFRALGVDGYACSGEPDDLFRAAGIDAGGIARAVRELAG